MSNRVNVTIKNVDRKDLVEMVDEVFGACIWVGGACYPDSECEIRIVEKIVENPAVEEQGNE